MSSHGPYFKVDVGPGLITLLGRFTVTIALLTADVPSFKVRYTHLWWESFSHRSTCLTQKHMRADG